MEMQVYFKGGDDGVRSKAVLSFLIKNKPMEQNDFLDLFDPVFFPNKENKETASYDPKKEDVEVDLSLIFTDKKRSIV